MSRQEVVAAILACTACPLTTRQIIPVPFRGPAPNDVVVVGEAPGRAENEAGQPFIGPAGALLDEALVAAGFELGSVTYLNPCCCWPQGTPGPEHLSACRGHFENQLALIGPRLALAVGNTALTALGIESRITSTRGRAIEKNGLTVFATWHPAAVLRDPTKKPQFFADVGAFAALSRPLVH